MEVRAAHHGERDEVLDLLARWYNDRAFFARYKQNDPAFRDALCMVARDRGRLVSTVQIFDRAINLNGQSVPMGGIGSVFTLEEYRHKGVASARWRLACRSRAHAPGTIAAPPCSAALLRPPRLPFSSLIPRTIPHWKEHWKAQAARSHITPTIFTCGECLRLINSGAGSRSLRRPRQLARSRSLPIRDPCSGPPTASDQKIIPPLIGACRPAPIPCAGVRLALTQAPEENVRAPQIPRRYRSRASRAFAASTHGAARSM